MLVFGTLQDLGVQSFGDRLYGVLAVLLLLLAAGLALPSAGSAQEPSVVILEQPAVSPPYTTTCDPDNTFWYPIDSGRGHTAYLTLNVASQSASTNSGVWRPNLPQAGFYKVEAYIPAHGVIEWQCPKKSIENDSRDARYKIHHAQGETTVSRDQATASGGWLDLGEYLFQDGEDGYVYLNDLNGETELSTTLSFSAVRFTWRAPFPFTNFVYLPYTGREMGYRILLNKTYTANVAGLTTNAFNPGETVQLSAAGYNEFGMAMPAAFEFRLSGPCGFNRAFAEELSLPSGAWVAVQEVDLPDCQGSYTFELKINQHTLVTTTSHVFVVNLPSQVIFTDRPAFDKCNIPTLAQLNTWYNHSPYKTVNLYMGGISRSCANTALTASFVSNAAQQGWTFIPTWVGPQAPCSRFTNKFSDDIGLAYVQGRFEADAAHVAAQRLGLGDGTVIYYNMEAYPNTHFGCREAVRSFLNGWTLRLHELSARAGVYGLPSNMNYWVTIQNAPDDVWIASWYASGYDPYASVWTVPNFSTSQWPYRRIRQYAGEVIETYGGLRMTIDANATLGQVARIPQAAALSSPAYGPARPAAAAFAGAPNEDNLPPVESLPFSTLAFLEDRVIDLQILPSGQGWLLSGSRLQWSLDAGRSWLDRTPQLTAGLLAANFTSEDQGWLVSRLPEGGLSLLRWQDETWQAEQFGLPPGLEEASFSAAQLEFLDVSTGWLLLKHQTSSNFSLGELFSTRDGGATWQHHSLPIYGKLSFISPSRGWIAGGPGGDELYTTVDGGTTWEPVHLDLARSTQPDAEQVYYGLPYFQDQENGLLPVTFSSEKAARLEIYQTRDQGGRWKLAGSLPLGTEPAPASPFQLAGFGSLARLVPPGEAAFSLAAIQNALPKPFAQSTLASQAESVPPGTTLIEISASGLGWAYSVQGECPAGLCRVSTSFWLTEDGGKTWSEITP